MRQPPPPLGLVDAERLEPPVEVARKRLRAAVVVAEREHAHGCASRGSAHGERGAFRVSRGLAQGAGDPLHLLGRPVAEERERDVQAREPEAP